MDEGEDDEPHPDTPSFGARLSAAKMFLELQRPSQAQQLLEELVEEQEDEPELYYLSALCAQSPEARLTLLQQALQAIAKGEAEGQQDLVHLKKVVLAALDCAKKG